MHRGSLFSCISPAFPISYLFNDSHSNRCKMASHGVFGLGQESWKEFPLLGKGEWGEPPASSVFRSTARRTLFCFSPPTHPETVKAEMYRDSLEQGGRAGATRISHAVGATTVPSVLLRRGPYQILPLKRLGRGYIRPLTDRFQWF